MGFFSRLHYFTIFRGQMIHLYITVARGPFVLNLCFLLQDNQYKQHDHLFCFTKLPFIIDLSSQNKSSESMYVLINYSASLDEIEGCLMFMFDFHLILFDCYCFLNSVVYMFE